MIDSPSGNPQDNPADKAVPSSVASAVDSSVPRSKPALLETSWFASLAPEYSDGNEVLLLESGGQFFPELRAQIDLAQSEIFLETYIFHDDPSARLIAHALSAAATRGVRVHLIVDGFGTGTIKQELLEIFALGPIQLQVFRPERKFITLERQRLRRLHRKLAVIDGTTAFVGGINILDDYFDPNHGALVQPRFDFAVRIRGPVIAPIHLAVTRMWWQLRVTARTFGTKAHQPLMRPTVASGKIEMPKSVFTRADPVGHLRTKFVLRDNFHFRKAIEKSYLRALGRAKNEVFIANAYFLPGAKFRRALIHAAKRGVKVSILSQGLPEYRLQLYASRALYQELLEAGIEIYEYKRSFLHAKVAIADDWATVGSSNIDPFSLLLAREANLVVLDKAFAQELKARLEAGVLAGGERVLLQNHSHLSWPVRMLHRLSFFVLRIAVAVSGASGRY